MKNVLIIYPHWPPSNLAGVHRPRLVANYLREFGWHPIVLTVDSKHYEEKWDTDLINTVSQDIEVIYTDAYPITKPRLIGDIGLRAFFQLRKKALNIIQERSIDFVWIPIPSFYVSIIGRMLWERTRTPYGIDYIDPWVRDISTRNDWRHRLSNWMAGILEPIAIGKAQLISGVSKEYFKPAINRNFSENDLPGTVSFPYGFDPNDHEIGLANLAAPWGETSDVIPWIYAGAFLPNSHIFLCAMFAEIRGLINEGSWNCKIRLYFLGTGGYSGKTIADYSRDYNLSEIVLEIKQRFAYLEVLNLLSMADTVMVIGSTEKHYTASKVFQSLLSKRPVWAIFHAESSAVDILEICNADRFLVKYHDGMSGDEIEEAIRTSLRNRINERSDEWQPTLAALSPYSANQSAKKLANAMNTVISK